MIWLSLQAIKILIVLSLLAKHKIEQITTNALAPRTINV